MKRMYNSPFQAEEIFDFQVVGSFSSSRVSTTPVRRREVEGNNP